jgi:hypothetical protein
MMHEWKVLPLNGKNLELATNKLSQELAEQLRLVMESILASKLQGDYRTGKRINMKKVLLFPMNLYFGMFSSPLCNEFITYYLARLLFLSGYSVKSFPQGQDMVAPDQTQ